MKSLQSRTCCLPLQVLKIKLDCLFAELWRRGLLPEELQAELAQVCLSEWGATLSTSLSWALAGLCLVYVDVPGQASCVA